MPARVRGCASPCPTACHYADSPRPSANCRPWRPQADITALNGAIEDLQASRSASAANRNQSAHDSTVVGNLKTRLAGATKEFKEVLTMRTDSLKVHQGRQQMFSCASPLKPMLGAPLRPPPSSNSFGASVRSMSRCNPLGFQFLLQPLNSTLHSSFELRRLLPR